MKISHIFIASAVALGASASVSAGDRHGYKNTYVVKAPVKRVVKVKVKVFKHYKHRKHHRRHHAKHRGHKFHGHKKHRSHKRHSHHGHY